MSILRKKIAAALQKKMVFLKASASYLIMVSVQDKLSDAGYTTTAYNGLLSVSKKVNKDDTELTVFELKQFPAMNYELYNLINEVKKYMGVDGRKWGNLKSSVRIKLDEDKYIPTDDEVKALGYKALTNEGNGDGKFYRHDEVVQSIYNKVVEKL